nr:molybdopterin-binding protein [uncultured Flavobacterium sp.]
MITIELPSVKAITVPFADLKNYKSHSIDSLQILNYLKEYKSTLKNIKGVLLKDVLVKPQFGEESPKILSEYFIICIADDGYKVTFSWNKLFNSPTGDNVLLVTEVNGLQSINQTEGIRIVTPTDFAAGRRYVKNLKTIKIERVN